MELQQWHARILAVQCGRGRVLPAFCACDQYKEKTPKDPTIRAKFNAYRFADYKDKVIDLLARVTRVSVQTQAIVAAMNEQAR
ncbi:MAG: hypothetical protein ACYC9P_11765 [Rudaea sp.]